MNARKQTLEGQAAAALGGLLKSRGHDLRDFHIAEDHDSDLVQMLGLVGGVIIVRRISTGEERLYSTGPGSAWFASLMSDLQQGHFATSSAPDAPAAPAADTGRFLIQ